MRTQMTAPFCSNTLRSSRGHRIGDVAAQAGVIVGRSHRTFVARRANRRRRGRDGSRRRHAPRSGIDSPHSGRFLTKFRSCRSSRMCTISRLPRLQSSDILPPLDRARTYRFREGFEDESKADRPMNFTARDISCAEEHHDTCRTNRPVRG